MLTSRVTSATPTEWAPLLMRRLNPNVRVTLSSPQEWRDKGLSLGWVLDGLCRISASGSVTSHC
jgi:hypothetical protein